MLLLLLPCLAALVAAHPGGYTGLGGMYKDMNMNPETMHHAIQAANMAKHIEQQNAFEQDESLRSATAARPARSYVPTFFTSEFQPQVQAGHVRTSRMAQAPHTRAQGPLYYNFSHGTRY